MNLEKYNVLLPYLRLQFTSHHNSLDLLLIMLMIDLPLIMLIIDYCLFCSHLDQEIKLID